MKKAKKKIIRRLSRAGDYHVLQVRFEPLAWQIIKNTAASRGVSACRLITEATMAGLPHVEGGSA